MARAFAAVLLSYLVRVACHRHERIVHLLQRTIKSRLKRIPQLHTRTLHITVRPKPTPTPTTTALLHCRRCDERRYQYGVVVGTVHVEADCGAAVSEWRRGGRVGGGGVGGEGGGGGE